MATFGKIGLLLFQDLVTLAFFGRICNKNSENKLFVRHRTKYFEASQNIHEDLNFLRLAKHLL